MKLIIGLIGIILGTWVGHTVYTPTQAFVGEVQEIYLKSKVIQKTMGTKSESTLNTIAESYKEVARVFGIKAAEESIKKEITSPDVAQQNAIEKLFDHNIALWLSTLAGFMTMSIYLNIIGIIGFFLKPITFFMK